MCGIAGYLGNWHESMLGKLAAGMAHRGPDGEGLWFDARAKIGLAHRRLSIIDLSSAASQPMESLNGRYQTVFNGEIYNYKAIAEELKAAGYKFNTRSDTAVLAPLYDHHGPAMLAKLEGIFAFAIWDAKERTLLVVRDHLGIKPLYYSHNAQGFTFASELKTLLPLLEDAALDPIAMAEYLTFLWTPGERTMLNSVRKVRPGHYLMLKSEANASKGTVQLQDFRWYAPPQPALAGEATEVGKPLYDDTKTPQQLLAALDAVVAQQCTSDVPVGAFLSGGVDSSAIVASMVATGNAPANTYCIGFEGPAGAAEGFEDDMAFAAKVAKHLKVPFTPIVMELDPLLKRLPTLPHMLDEPTADPAPLLVEDIAARARADGITVLLSGAGGDDVLSGYRRHQAARMREFLGSTLCQVAGQGLVALELFLNGRHKRRIQRLQNLLASDDNSFLLHAFTTNSQPDAWKLLKPDHRHHMHDGWSNALTAAREECTGQSLLNRLLYMELFGFLPDHNLNYTDKAAMRAGVETRVPLTDRRILSFMADVPPEKKLRRSTPKWFFKQAVSPRLPPQVIARSKTGFGAPIRAWLTTGVGRSMMEEALFDSPFSEEWYHRPAVEFFWKQTINGQLDGSYTALAIAMQVWWAKHMLTR